MKFNKFISAVKKTAILIMIVTITCTNSFFASIPNVEAAVTRLPTRDKAECEAASSNSQYSYCYIASCGACFCVGQPEPPKPPTNPDDPTTNSDGATSGTSASSSGIDSDYDIEEVTTSGRENMIFATSDTGGFGVLANYSHVYVNPSTLYITPNSAVVNSDVEFTLTRQGDAVGDGIWSVNYPHVCEITPGINNGTAGDTAILNCINASYGVLENVLVTLTIEGVSETLKAQSALSINPPHFTIVPGSATLKSRESFTFTRQGELTGDATWTIDYPDCEFENGERTTPSTAIGDTVTVSCINTTGVDIEDIGLALEHGESALISNASISLLTKDPIGIAINDVPFTNFPARTSGTLGKDDSVTYGENIIDLGTDEEATVNYAKANRITFAVNNDGDPYDILLEDSSMGTINNITDDAACMGIGQTQSCTGIIREFYFESANKEGTVNIIVSNNYSNLQDRDRTVLTIHVLPPAVEDIQILDDQNIPITTPVLADKSVEMQLNAASLLYDGSEKLNAEDEIVWEFLYEGDTAWSSANTKAIITNGLFRPSENGIYEVRAKMVQSVAGPGENDLTYTTEEIISSNTVTIVVDDAAPQILSIRTTGNASAAKGTHDKLYIEVLNINGTGDLERLEVSLVNGEYSAPGDIPANVQTFDIIETAATPSMNVTGQYALLQVPIYIPELGDIHDGVHTIFVKLFTKSDKVAEAVYPISIGIPARGDVNGDGLLSLMDAIMTIKFYAKTAIPTAIQLQTVDFNNDGKVNLLDVVGVLRRIVDNQNGTNPFTTCTKVNPTVVVTPSIQTGNAGDDITYTVIVINNNMGSCGANIFNLSSNASTVIPSTTATLEDTTVTLAAGMSDTTTIELDTNAGTPASTYIFNVTATSGTFSDAATGTLIIN